LIQDENQNERGRVIMNRVLYGIIVVVVMLCFCGLGPSIAADKPKPIFGEEKHGVDNATRGSNVRTSIGGLPYYKEAYAAIAPSAGESYNQSAESVFSPSETIYLTDRYYIGITGTYTRYYFIADVVGTIVAWSSKTFTVTAAGYYWGTKTISFATLGSYVYYSLTTGPEWLTSPRFSFTVE